MKSNPVVHFEMPYENADRLKKFYERVFGWNMHQLGKDMGDYVLAGTAEMDKNMMIKEPGSINGGFFPKTAESHNYPSVVVSVDDINAAIENIRKEGGKVLGEPVNIPGIGLNVAFIDTEGNYASVLQPEKK